MGIDETRHRQPAGEIDHFGIIDSQLQHLSAGSNRQNASPANGKRLCERLFRVLGGDLAVKEDDFGMEFGSFHNKNP